MFGRKKKTGRVISSWDDLSTALIAIYDANEAAGGLRVEISWRREKRKREVRVSYAQAPGLGDIAFFSTTIAEQATDERIEHYNSEVSRMLEGGFAVEKGELVLRVSRVLDGVPFTEISRMMEQLATNAEVLASDDDEESAEDKA